MSVSYVRSRPTPTPIWVALFLLLLPGYAQALSILSSSRSVRLDYSTGIDPSGYPILAQYSATDPVGYGPWSAGFAAGTASVSQGSLVDTTELSGGAGVSAFWYYEFAQSQYQVVFSVDALTPYSFGVDNVDAGFPSFYGAQGSVRLEQVDPSNPSNVIQSIYSIALGRDPFTGAGYPDVSEQGALGPGTYKLRFDLSHGGTHNYGDPGSAGFGLIVIPEPQAGLLTGFGLAALALRRTSRTASRRALAGRPRDSKTWPRFEGSSVLRT